jgi:hypothetical protein
MQPVYKKYEFAIADPKTWQTMEADFNNVISMMIAGGALQGTIEVLAGFARLGYLMSLRRPAWPSGCQ